MKKIFRMALVFALAGATLMYTGCTKDYSEDINKLDGEISSLEGKYQDLLNQLADAKSSLEAAYKAADQTLEGNFDKKIAEINAAIAKKADAAAIEAEMEQLKKDLMAEADKLQKSAESLKKEVQDLLDDFYAAVSGELRALVVIPDFYYAGVEATSYDFALIRSFIAEKNTADVTSGNFKFPKADKLRFVFDSLKKNNNVTYPNDYSLGQKGIVNYDLNPSAYDVADAEWSLAGLDRKYTVKGDSAAKVWAPNFLAIENKNGVAVVNYEILNPDLLFASVDSAATAPKYTNVPVMQLIATLEEGKTVSSDWVAITSGVDSIAHLAFTAASKDSTKFADDCGLLTYKADLYDYAVDAATDTASVFWAYNAGALDLAKIINIHVQDANGDIVAMTLDQLNAKYPGFSYNFELVPYTIGANVTGEDYYGKLDGSEFTPCYVKSEGGKPESIAIAKDSKEGTSAVGRMPVVLVTLKDAKGLVAAAGYFKIQIVKDPVAPAEPDYFDIPSFGKFPFVCDSLEKGTTWHEFSYFVLEALGTDYAEFSSSYRFTDVYANEITDAKTGKTEFIKIDTAGLGITKYGNITYTPDASGTGINDAITWKIYPKGIGEGKSKEVFLKFQGPKTVYFKLTAEVAKAAGFDFGANKIANEWYDDIDGEPKNTVRINVLVPSATADSVTKFYRDLNRFYIGYKPAAELSADSDPIYKETPDSLLETSSKFYFAAEQPVINGQKLITNAAGDSLFVVTETTAAGAVKDSAIIATLVDSTGVITYNWEEGDTEAKKLLNLWSYTATSQDSMLFANVLVKTAYGECEIPAGEENFHVRFVRPLDVKFEAQDVAQESAVQGFNVKVVDFISGIVDWNKQSVIIDSLDNQKKPTGNMIENVIKGVNMYQYYKFDSLVVDIDAALRDNFDTKDLNARDTLLNVTPEAQLTLGTVDNNDIYTKGESNKIEISSFANLKNAAINYKNDRAVIETFNIFIPVKIYYSWGVLNAELEINVKPTSETDPK